MKLELKHLAGYLPYGLKVQYVCSYNDSLKVKDLEIYNVNYSLLKQYKPILRPLSYLTKQKVLDMIEYSDFEDIYFNGNPSDLIFVNTEDNTYLSDILKNTEFLFKNHFDVYGLIEAGLAIDINTLKNDN
jgi:hypothetical protein